MYTNPSELSDEPLIRVMALHAVAYCPRLFYLEEVEEIRRADASVWSGRRLHEELNEQQEEVVTLTLESEELGIRGKLDAVRRRHGESYPVEHKRGRALRDGKGKAHAWESDFVQACAYAFLLSEHLGEPVVEARVHYHADNVTVKIPIGAMEHDTVMRAVRRARQWRQSIERPPVTEAEGRCNRCSLSPVCLPEETRLASALAERRDETQQELPGVEAEEKRTIKRLFPVDAPGRSLHVVKQGAKVGVTKGRFRVQFGKEILQQTQINAVSDVTLHGHAQISTQCLRACASQEIPVHWVTMGGSYAGSFFGPSVSVQRKLRQYEGLSDETRRVELSRRIIEAKIAHQRQHIMRGSRKSEPTRRAVKSALKAIKRAGQEASRADQISQLLGYEGQAAKAYFEALGELVTAGEVMKPSGRSRRPPRDRFNALLSFLYGQLYRDVLSAVMRVGLEPALGVLHTPRSAAPPLALDLMEIFRVPVVDMAVLGAINRKTFNEDEDFCISTAKVWLSEQGRKKALAVYERRKHEEYKHPVLDYSLSYARQFELEVRLLEKEWCGEEGLFATWRLR